MKAVQTLLNRLPDGWRTGLRRARNGLQAPFLPTPIREALPFTLLSPAKLRNLAELARSLNNARVEGDFVECGTWNGGSGAVLAWSAAGRLTWLYDSFSGLPAAGAEDGRDAGRFAGRCRGSEAAVREALRRLSVPAERVRIVEGWFERTLQDDPRRPIALLHIDADWHASVREALTRLGPKLAVGGYLVVDDYGYWPGCRKAVEDYLAVRTDLRPAGRVEEAAVFVRVPEPA